MSSRILMLRHGITEGNKKKWFYGGLDLPLLPEGKEKLRELKAQGLYPEIPENARFFTSGMIRTKETLETLFGEREYGEIPALKEMNFGDLEGRSFSEIKDEPAFIAWSYDDSGDVEFPGGESRNQFTTRVKRGMGELLSKHRLLEEEVGKENAFTVLVCHGGVIASMMYEFFPDDRSDMWEWMSEPGCGYILEMGEDGPESVCQIGELTVYYDDEEE